VLTQRGQFRRKKDDNSLMRRRAVTKPDRITTTFDHETVRLGISCVRASLGPRLRQRRTSQIARPHMGEHVALSMRPA